MTRFFDAEIKPPRGGWSFPINGEVVTRHSEGEIIDAIARWQKNNGKYVSDVAIANELWAYYCSREPGRCGMSGVAPVSDYQSPLVRRDITPEVQGPAIWLFLNTLACQWTPGLHDYFLATCDAIIVMLECPDCRNEWRRLLEEYPPVKLSTRFAVCRWVNMVHNKVSERKGRSPYPYRNMVTEFGAPIS